jgi:hypothetical protein
MTAMPDDLEDGAPIRPGEGGEGVVDDRDVPFPDDVPDTHPEPQHVSGALMLSFGAVHTGREKLAVETFTEVSRFLGRLLADDDITAFKPFFFADGVHGDSIGFFLIEGDRVRLDDLRRRADFQRMLLRAGAATASIRVQTLIAGTEAGRLVNLYADVRGELGLL